MLQAMHARLTGDLQLKLPLTGTAPPLRVAALIQCRMQVGCRHSWPMGSGRAVCNRRMRTRRRGTTPWAARWRRGSLRWWSASCARRGCCRRGHRTLTPPLRSGGCWRCAAPVRPLGRSPPLIELIERAVIGDGARTRECNEVQAASQRGGLCTARLHPLSVRPRP